MRILFGLIAAIFAAGSGPALAQSYQPPRHTSEPPAQFTRSSPAELAGYADRGIQVDQGKDPRVLLAEQRKLTKALGALLPQRKGVVDAYVVSIAMDSDPVFGREAREAGHVLSRRFDAAGRTITLAGTNGSAPSDLPMGTPETLGIALARVTEVMDPKEDVLILYETSHGAPWGVVYNDGNQGFGAVSPTRLATMLYELGISRRMLIISACYSGIFLAPLADDMSVVVTAARSDRTSFGCRAENDWTFFGDAFVNLGMRKPQPLAAAFAEAQGLIAGWEAIGGVKPSEPQIAIGAKVESWLAPLEQRMPRVATDPVGKPAISAFEAPK